MIPDLPIAKISYEQLIFNLNLINVMSVTYAPYHTRGVLTETSEKQHHPKSSNRRKSRIIY